MALYVNTNINAMIAQRSLNSSTSSLQKAITQLSTGMRVNHSGDDAAGLCVAQGLETLIRGNTRAKSNIQDGLNMMYIAEGAMESVLNDLQRIRELSLQVANEVYSPEQKQTMMNEIDQRLKNVSVTANTTQFNGVFLTNDTAPAKMTLQIGSGSDGLNNSIDVRPALTDLRATSLGLRLNIVSMTTPGVAALTPGASGIDATGATLVNGSNWEGDNVRKFIESLDVAINRIAENRSALGAFQNRLQSASDNLTVMNENYSQSKSQIMDADMADASANMIKYQVLQQSSAAMLTQANQLPSIALQLIGS